jgi:four helix bundle protein
MVWRTSYVARPFPFPPISPRASASASGAEKARFLNIAEGSVEECRYYLILSQDLGYGQSELLAATLEETSKLLNAYVRAILASGS